MCQFTADQHHNCNNRSYRHRRTNRSACRRLCCLGFQISHGKIQGCEDPLSPVGVHRPVDYFAGSVWDEARRKAVRASIYMRQHGPFMPGILGPEEMEYTTRPAVLKKLKDRMENID